MNRRVKAARKRALPYRASGKPGAMALGESRIRSLPRVFIPGANPAGPIGLPREEVDKLRKVLRLESGALIAVLPGDGTLIPCELQGSEAIPCGAVQMPETESARHIVIAQALPKGDKLDAIVRCCTEIGVAGFVLFPADRSVVRWDASKLPGRLERYRVVAREAAEQSFRTRVPTVEAAGNLAEVLSRYPSATVLSEVEGVTPTLVSNTSGPTVIVVGPEGGWAPRELEAIGPRGVTLGPRVLRVDTAAIAAASLLLLA